MLPKIWIFNSYGLCIAIGVVLAIFLFDSFIKKQGVKEKERTVYEMCGLISIMAGIVFAILFQYFYNVLKDPKAPFDFSMTFLGGFIGGSICFIILYLTYIRRLYSTPLPTFLKIIPACICLAHSFGRIGCFLSGCCYGIETDSWLGIKFPDLVNKVYPTQLFEAIFLFVLCVLLLIIAYRKWGNYSLVIYLSSYGIFRFFIEFIRGDDRGFMLLNLSPSQWISIFLILISVVLFFLIKKKKLIWKNQ